MGREGTEGREGREGGEGFATPRPNGAPRARKPENPLINLRKHAVVLIDGDALQRGIEADALVRRLLLDGDHDVDLLPARVLQRQGNGHMEHLADLVDVDGELPPLDSILHLQMRQRGPVDPLIEETLQRTSRFGFERFSQIIGSHFAETRCKVEPPHAAEERLVADEPTEHMKDRCAFVVNERAEDAAVVLDVAKAVPQIDRALIGLAHRPAAHMTQDALKHRIAALMLCVEGREVLRKSLAQPLLVVVAPAHRLSEPLMRQLVRDEEVGKLVERRGIVPPDDLIERQRLNNFREVCRAVAAREIASRDRYPQRYATHIPTKRTTPPRYLAAALAQTLSTP